MAFNAGDTPAPQRDADLMALDHAPDNWAKTDPRGARVVELRFFGGLSEAKTAHVLGGSAGTDRREWDFARVWLLRERKRGAPP
jgi:hypothetical protein